MAPSVQRTATPTPAKAPAKPASLIDKGIAYAEQHPAKVIGTAVAASLVVANRDRLEKAGENLVQAAVDHPVKTGLVLGAGTLAMATHGAQIEAAVDPKNYGKEAHEIATYAHANPVKTGIATTAVTYAALKLAKNSLDLGTPVAGGYRVGDKVGFGTVVDPAAPRTSGEYKIVAIDFNHNGKIDPGEQNQLTVKVPDGGSRIDNIFTGTKDSALKDRTDLALSVAGAAGLIRVLFSEKLWRGSVKATALPIAIAMAAGGAIGWGIGQSANVNPNRKDSKDNLVPDLVPPKADR